MSDTNNKVFKVLLLNLVSNGDCIYVTAIARQIKKDYPGCHLTWMISNLCKQVLLNNPDVDEVVVVQVDSVRSALFEGWYKLKKHLLETDQLNQYDKVFSPQFFPENLQNFDGTIRSTLFRCYPDYRKIDVTPIIELTSQEVENAKRFICENKIESFSKVILFECSPASGQSFVTPELALQLSSILVGLFPDMVVILSTHVKLEIDHDRIKIANTISFRENAELIKVCGLLVGASSGITWLCTSSWVSKKLPMIQLVNKKGGASFASVSYDFAYWGLDDSQVVEITKPDISYIVNCIKLFYKKDIHACKENYHEILKPDPFYIKDYFNMLAKRKKIRPLFGLFKNFAERNGISFRLFFAFVFIFIQGVFRLPYVLIKGMK